MSLTQLGKKEACSLIVISRLKSARRPTVFTKKHLFLRRTHPRIGHNKTNKFLPTQKSPIFLFPPFWSFAWRQKGVLQCSTFNTKHNVRTPNIFTNSAPLGRVGLSVTMFVCMYVFVYAFIFIEASHWSMAAELQPLKWSAAQWPFNHWIEALRVRLLNQMIADAWITL